MQKVLVVAVLLVGGLACGPEPEWSSSGTNSSVGTYHGPQAMTSPLSGTSVEPIGDGRLAVADPDGDSVFLVKGTSRERLKFPAGSRPMRAVQAGDQLAVLLRGSGQLARVPLKSGSSEIGGDALTAACPEPRGLAWDPLAEAVLVACAGGELVVDAKAGRSVVQTGLELRDVMVAAGSRWVTTFRSADLIELTADGQVKTLLAPPSLNLAQVTFRPRVAWRAVIDGSRVIMVHQLHVNDEVTLLTNPGPGAPYYGKPYCSASVVSSALTVFDLNSKTVAWSRPIIGALPVDVAVGTDRVAVAFAGAGQVSEYAVSGVNPPLGSSGGCLYPVSSSPPGVPTGVGYVGAELHWFEPAGVLHRHNAADDRELAPLREVSQSQQLFHAQSPSGVSCASCHPEGYDDGHTWQFGTRHVRSQSLEGGLLSTSPYHWDGRFRTVGAVLEETLVVRMGGARADTSVVNDLSAWLDRVPARAPSFPIDPSAAKMGRLVFTRAGCGSCHAGDEYTNGTTVDIGTGGAFQVPSLKALRFRGPWLHSGCAMTLEQRFDPACGGARHGTVAPGDVPDLVEFLKTL